MRKKRAMRNLVVSSKEVSEGFSEEDLATPPKRSELEFFAKHLESGHDLRSISNALGYSGFVWAQRYKRHPQYREILSAFRGLRADYVHERFTNEEVLPSLEIKASANNEGLWKSLRKKQEFLTQQKAEDAPKSFENASSQQAISVTTNVDMRDLDKLMEFYTPKGDGLKTDSHNKVVDVSEGVKGGV